MRRFLVVATLSLAAVAAACGSSKPAHKEQAKAPPPKEEPPAPPPPQDAQVVLNQDEASPVVSVRLVFRSGCVDDPAGSEGITSLTASLMSEATEQLDAAAFAQALFPYATHVSTYTGAETTVFSMTVHREVAAKALPQLLDVVAAPRWDTADFERLRDDHIVAIEKHLRQANDEGLGHASLNHYLWAGHPYARYSGGTVQGLKAMTLEAVKAHRAKVFTQSRLVAGIGGGFDAGLERLLRDGIARFPRGEHFVPVALPQLPPVEGMNVHIVKKQTESSPITMGFRYGLDRRNPDFHLMMVANAALGEHRQMAGRLFQRMREARGLNYGDYTYIEHFVQEGWDTLALLNIPRRQHAFKVWIRPVEPDDRVFAMRLALFELRRFIDGGLTQEELDGTRNFLTGYTLLWEQGTSRKLGYAIDDVLNGTPGFLAAFRERMKTATLDEVNAAIKRHLSADHMVVTMLGPDADALKAALLDGKPSVRSEAKTKNLEEKYKEEDKIVAGYDLRLTPERVSVIDVDQLFEK